MTGPHERALEAMDETVSALVGYACTALALPAEWAHARALEAWRETRAAGQQVAPSDRALLALLEAIEELGQRARIYRDALVRELAPPPPTNPRDPKGPIPDDWAV